MTDEPIGREEVHEALACLNDNLRLARTRFASRFSEPASPTTVDTRAERIRSELLQAIEVLRPPRRLPFGSGEARSYDVLSLRYAGSLSIGAVCEELSLSRRQVHRDLVQAEERLVQVLTQEMQSGTAAWESRAAELSSELTQVSTEPTYLELASAVRASLVVLEPLLRKLGADVRLEADAGNPYSVLADASLLRQVLVQSISIAAQAAATAIVKASITSDERSAGVHLSFVAGARVPSESRLADLCTIAAAGALECRWHISPSAESKISVLIQRIRSVRVLVVEDNPSAVELYRRYIDGPEWEVSHVDDPRRTYDVARTLRPDLIVLDVMLPKMDGWTVLGLLSGARETADIPIVICSVVDERELGGALGAAAYITKPVSRHQFVSTLRDVLSRRSRSRLSETRHNE